MLLNRRQRRPNQNSPHMHSKQGWDVCASIKHLDLHSCLLQCQSVPLGLNRPYLMGNVMHVLHLEEEILTPLSALGFQHCCLAQCPPPDGLIKSLEERVASHFSSPYLLATRKYELMLTTRLLRLVNPGGLRQQRQQEQHTCAGVQIIEAHWFHNVAEVYCPCTLNNLCAYLPK